MQTRRYTVDWEAQPMMQDKKQRFEFKYWIGWREYNILQPRLASLLSRDPHTDSNGEYKIRSLYFDSWKRMCVHECLPFEFQHHTQIDLMQPQGAQWALPLGPFGLWP